MNRNLSVREYEFTLVLEGIAEVNDEVHDALFEAGCDDSTLAVRLGRPFLAFSRSAQSLKDAILSAIRDVRKAGIGANVLRVDYCNLVTQADIARRIGRSRQNIHQYIQGERGPGSFPSPVCEITDDSPLWYWCEVASWLCENGIVKEDVLREAEEVDVINAILALKYQKRINGELTEDVMRYLEAV